MPPLALRQQLAVLTRTLVSRLAKAPPLMPQRLAVVPPSWFVVPPTIQLGGKISTATVWQQRRSLPHLDTRGQVRQASELQITTGDIAILDGF